MRSVMVLFASSRSGFYRAFPEWSSRYRTGDCAWDVERRESVYASQERTCSDLHGSQICPYAIAQTRRSFLHLALHHLPRPALCTYTWRPARSPISLRLVHAEVIARRSSPFIDALHRTRQGEHILVRPECDSSRARLPIHNHHPTQRDRSALSRSVDDVDVALRRTTSEGGREGNVLAADGERGLDALCRKGPSAHPTAAAAVDEMVRTLPAALGDVDRVALDHRGDCKADVARLAGRGRRRALALLDRARDAAADLEQGDV